MHSFSFAYFLQGQGKQAVNNGLLEWTTGMDCWNGLLEWTTGMDCWNGLLEWTAGMDCWNDIFFALKITLMA